ncbi:hypothetical protein BGW39_011721 [Mortierella sp. 14UC]|nr:hypothetical protein BGW39_011721 [Mortierella sp. 14UC]
MLNYQISDSPIVNGVQPQSSSDTEVSGANKAETKGTQPPAAPVAQTDSKPQDVPHAMVASTPPPSTAATEPQTAPKPEVTAVPPSSPQSVQELKAASEPEAVSDPISTEAITDKQETKGDALVTQEEPATPQPIPALVAEAKPEPQTVAPAAEAKPELQPAPAQEPKLEAAPVAQEKPTPEADPVLAQEAKHEAASTPQFKSDPKAAPELKEASEQSLTPTLLSTEDAADAKEPKTTAPVTQEEPTNPRPAPVAADPKPKPQPAAPVAEGKPKPEPFPAAVEEKPVPHSGPAQESNHEAFSTPPSTEDTTNAKEAKPATVAQDETQPEPAPAAVEVKPEPQPAPAPAQEKPKPQPAPVTHAPPEAEALLIPTTATECLTLLLKTQQSLTESCQKLIRTDANLIQAAELGLVGLDFMYSKGTPVISIDGFRLKFSQLPGHTLSVIESRHDVTIAYEGADVATFSPPWASATMDGSTLNSPIDHVDIKVLSDNAFSDFVATLITKPEANIVLRGVVDVNVSIASAAGGPPKTFIIAGLQFSSPIRLDGLNNLTQKKFVQSNGYQVYGEDFYFSSVISFANPSNLDITFGSVSFDAIDGAGKPLSNSAIDVFEITSDDNDVELRLISNVDDSMAFLNKLHSSGDTVTFQGTTASSTNKILAAALSQLKFTVTYPAVADIPPQTPLVAPMPGGV